MKTKLNIIDAVSGKRPLFLEGSKIEYSSRNLGWEGIVVETGTCEGVFSERVVSPDFLFTIDLKDDGLRVNIGDDLVKVKNEEDFIWINSPDVPFILNNQPANCLVMSIRPEVLFSHFQGYLPKKGLSFINDYGIQDAFMVHMLQMFLLEVKNEGCHGKCFLNNLITLFSNHFISNYSNIKELRNIAYSGRALAKHNIALINRFVDQHINEVINIDALADQVKMSKYKFLKEFKKHTGMTPYQYIINSKIDKAKDLLLRTNKSLVDIALELGFSDSSHFARTFKKLVYQTPSQYRESNVNSRYA